MNVSLSELTLYRYRYVIGYTLLGMLIVGLLLLNIQTLPPGLSETEQASALTSYNLNLSFSLENLGQDILTFLQTTNAIDLPYHLLQKASLELFGLSPLGVRSPTIMLAAASAFMVLVLLKRFLLPSAAMLMGAFIATSAWFLSVGRLGTPDIMVVFWTTLIILLAILISQESRYVNLWRVLGLMAIGLSLYTPYTVYLFLAAAAATMTQPHLRYLIRYANKPSVSVGIFLLLLMLVPLGFHMWREPSIIWQLVGFPPDLAGPLAFLQNLVSSLSDLANPFNVQFQSHPLPLLSLAMVFFVAVGIWRLVIDWHSVRSHSLLIWLAILLPIVGLSASPNLSVLFVPLTLVSGIGVQALFKYWYTIFPRNPYARVFGLLPIGLLVFSLLQFNYQRYFLALPFAPTTVATYNQDPFLLHQAISSKANRTQRMVLVAPADKQELYKIEQALADKLIVVTAPQFRSGNNATRVIVAESELSKLNARQRALLPRGKTELLVSDRKEQALRFRIYSTPQ